VVAGAPPFSRQSAADSRGIVLLLVSLIAIIQLSARRRASIPTS
jgi:hypothetical protein